MPLLRKSNSIRKGDLLVLTFSFPDTWDYLLKQDCEEEFVTMEICLTEVLGDIGTSIEGFKTFEVREFGLMRYDPRSYCGYSFFAPRSQGGGHCYVAETPNVFGAINGTLPVQDRLALKTLLRGIVRQYRPHINKRYQEVCDFLQGGSNECL